jgi:parallel beta-helix repeat protein
MGRKGISVCLVMALLLGAIVVIDVTVDITPRVEATTIYVDDDYGSEDATHKMTIQAAVDAANPGDTVYVYNGIYIENVYINKTLTLTGEDKNLTIVDGNYLDIVFWVDWSDYVNISGFTLKNGFSGISLVDSNYCFVSNNIMIDNSVGFSTSGSFNRIANNTVTNSTDYGYAVYDYYNYIEQSNLVDGEVVHYYYDIHGTEISPIELSGLDLITPNVSSVGKINLINCSYILVQNSSFSNNTGTSWGYGIYIYESNNITVYHNTIYNNKYGIYVRYSDNISVLNNNVSNCSWRGIFLANSLKNKVHNNTLYNCNGNIGTSRSNFVEIFNNSIDSDEWGIDIFSDSNFITISSNRINVSSNGIYINGGVGNYLEGNTVISEIGDGIQIRNVDFIKVINSSIISGVWDFQFMNNGWVYSINNSFNKSAIYFSGYTNFTVQWYLHVNVTNFIGQPVSNATVNVVDSNKSLPVNKYQTDSNGYARWIVGTEYIQTSSGKTYYTPHRITAWNETLMGYAEVNINESKEVNIVLDTPYSEIPLTAGWNLISLPLVQSDTSIATVLNSIAGNWDVVWWYNASGGTWHSTNDDLTDINHTMGFWIHMKTADTLIVTGTIPNTTFIQLYQGRNLVGNPSFCIHGIDDILSPIATKYTAVQQYDSWDGGDPWKHYHINKPSNLNDLAYMTSGRGYWLYVNEDVIWEVNNF